MNKLLILSFFLYTVAALRSSKREQVDSKHLESVKEKKNLTDNKQFNLRENINYERKNNYELYIDKNGQNNQQKFGVNEPRQILKKNVGDLRYLINDLEVLTGVYEFNARDKEKVLRETLKPESLCFMIVGLLSNTLNRINIEDSPLYGLIIKGQRTASSVNNLLDISAVLSNITLPLGLFEFPLVKKFPYQIPFLVGHYDSRTGYKNKNFSYICPLPKFLIDVIRTTKSGLKFSFNGNDLEARELFPITLTYLLENNSAVAVQKEDANKDERERLFTVLNKEATDVAYRPVKNTGAEGVGIEKPIERILASKSFSGSRNKIRDFLGSAGKSSLDTASTALYFLNLSQKLFTKKSPSDFGRIAHIKVTNVQKSKTGYLSRFTVEVGLENSRWVSVTGVVSGKNVPVPANLTGSQTVRYDVPFLYAFSLDKNGLSYGFCGLNYTLDKAFPYNLNNLASFVKSA